VTFGLDFALFSLGLDLCGLVNITAASRLLTNSWVFTVGGRYSCPIRR